MTRRRTVLDCGMGIGEFALMVAVMIACVFIARFVGVNVWTVAQ